MITLIFGLPSCYACFLLLHILCYSRPCNAATTTTKFREELEAFFGTLPAKGNPPRTHPVRGRYEGCPQKYTKLEECPHAFPHRNTFPVSPLTVLELGIHEGSTTVVLSVLFHRVIAVENDMHWLRESRKKQDVIGGLPNVVFIPLDLYRDNLRLFTLNQIEVVFIDAAHDYPSVKSDAMHALQIPTVEWVVFHDYNDVNQKSGAIYGMHVKLVVDELVSHGFLDCGSGSPPPPAQPYAVGVPQRPGALGEMFACEGCSGDLFLPEAVLCSVLRRWHWGDIPAMKLAIRHVKDNQITHASKLNSRVWYIYTKDNAAEIPERAPDARCLVNLLALHSMSVRCQGKILYGNGYARFAHNNFLHHMWNITGAGGAILDVIYTTEFTSFNALLQSGATQTNVLGFSKQIFDVQWRRELSFINDFDASLVRSL